ncbi:hypothetical protein L6R52_08145 [Myxococcota bacterium]|nr:hypothetical protein [Myxococcota bacterium]
MLTSAIILPLVGGLISQAQFPTSEDHLRASQGEKRVTLVMDVSGSMASGALSTPACVHYNTANGVAVPFYLNKNEQMKAALNGCVTATDGLFDQWASQIDFAIVAFGYNPANGPAVALVQNFTRSVPALETAVQGLPADWSTPMAWGVMEGHVAHQWWTDATPNTYQCDQHFNILMTDGFPNDPAAPTYTMFPCAAPVAIDPEEYNPVNTTQYAWGGGTRDAVCGLNGEQPIATYTIGFGAPGDFNPTLLTNMAAAGGGRYYYAGNAAQLASVFDDILSNITDRTVTFSPPSVQTDGLYVGNDVYVPSFRPRAQGPWVGNLKSYCVVPELDAVGNYVDEYVNDRCLFKSVAGVLVTNASPQDRFSLSRDTEADSGGVGEIFYRDYMNNQPPAYNAGGDPDRFEAEFSPFFERRNVITWDNSGYKAARPDTMTDNEAFASGCAKTRLFAYLHGYDPNTVECRPGNGGGVAVGNPNRPTQLADWPIGAAVNSMVTILRWDTNCNVAGNCLVVFGADDGGVHFIDTATGRETTMLVPKHLFSPGTVANYPLANVLDQPSRLMSRRSYVDGGLMRLHDDVDGDGVIDNTETAYLVFGLGKGGRGLYFMDVRQRFNGTGFTPTSARNQVYPIVATRGNWTENLRDMVAKPWVGRVRMAGAATPEIMAVFGSGHEWYLTRPTELLNNPNGLVGLQGPLEAGSAQTLTCANANAFAAYNGYRNDGRDFCEGLLVTTPISPIIGYDCIITGCSGIPRDQVFGPLWYRENSGPGSTLAASIGMFQFRTLDLGPNDYLVFEDLDGNPLSDELTGTLATSATAPYTVPIWINAPFRIRVHVDGVWSANQGVDFESLQWIPDTFAGGCLGGDPCASCDTNNDGECRDRVGECQAGSPQAVLQACILCDQDGDGECRRTDDECGLPDYRTCGPHYPFVVGVGINRINGATRRAWADTTDNGSVRLMFTKVCPAGVTAGGGLCYDQTVANNTDLQFMNCPITAEVRAYDEGGVARAFYVGDQCGQMWKFHTNDGGRTWASKRVFRLTQNNATGQSRDFRKFDRAVELTVSTCKGGRAVGVYFGTGNTSRPGAMDNLMGPTRNTVQAVHLGSDMIGAWFDDGSWDTGNSRSIADFKNVTPNRAFETVDPATTFTSADAQMGWYIALRAAAPAAATPIGGEQMLRDPLVFDGVAYYKTNQATQAATTCLPGRTLDRIYAVNACSSAPADPSGANAGAGTAADREAWSGDTAVGGGIFLYTPRTGQPILSHGDFSNQTAAQLIPPRPNARQIRMFLWWRGV